MGNACCTWIIRVLDKESDRTVFMSGIQFRICLDTDKWKGDQGWIVLEKWLFSAEEVKYSILLVSYPDGIMLEPFVSTGQQSEMPVPEGWDIRNRNGGEKAGCMNCLWDDTALEKIGHIESRIFCKERTFAQNEHESDLESCVWLWPLYSGMNLNKASANKGCQCSQRSGKPVVLDKPGEVCSAPMK